MWLNSVIRFTILCYKPKAACWYACNRQWYKPPPHQYTLEYFLDDLSTSVSYTDFLYLPDFAEEEAESTPIIM